MFEQVETSNRTNGRLRSRVFCIDQVRVTSFICQFKNCPHFGLHFRPRFGTPRLIEVSGRQSKSKFNTCSLTDSACFWVWQRLFDADAGSFIFIRLSRLYGSWRPGEYFLCEGTDEFKVHVLPLDNAPRISECLVCLECVRGGGGDEQVRS